MQPRHPVDGRTLCRFLVSVASSTCLANLSWDILDMAEPTYLRSLCSEKWLDIQGFTNFTAAHLS